MTGFGRGVAERGRTRATVDLRAVNHRYLDLKLRGGALAPALEDAVSARVRGVLERGAVTVTIHVSRSGPHAAVRIDHEAARTAHDALAALALALGLPGPDLALVLAQPGVIVPAELEPDDGEDVAVRSALDAALAQLLAMRDDEGAALARELSARLDELSALRVGLERLAADLPERTRRRLHDRLHRLLRDEAADKASDAAGWVDPTGGAAPRPTGKAGGVPTPRLLAPLVDPARLAQEIALVAERGDVTEELVRLASHLDQARALVSGRDAAGRRLDFLVQEIGRELNTIGSKSSLAEVSTAIVDAKAVLEKVREQVQNVE
jgi:uncharacterized protein YicC (UPF0701 family)